MGMIKNTKQILAGGQVMIQHLEGIEKRLRNIENMLNANFAEIDRRLPAKEWSDLDNGV